jgi:hypothetical protein
MRGLAGPWHDERRSTARPRSRQGAATAATLDRWVPPAARHLIVIAAALLLSGCASTVRPPENPVDPAEVFLTEEGIHRGLILPGASGYVEYAYGEWGWYVLGRHAWYHVFDTVLWPTQGALGRRSYDDPRAEFTGEKLTSFRAARSAVEALLAELDTLYESARATEVYNERTRMHFVKISPGFWCFFNCSDATAAWLRRLGCDVSWVPIRGGFRAAEPQP